MNNQSVGYKVHASYSSNTVPFTNCVVLDYGRTPILTGLNRIVFADSIGPIELGDMTNPRIPTYYLDSCSIGGVVKQFKK